MTFEEALRVELIKIEGLNNKVFPLNAVEGVKAPYIVYESSLGLEDKTLGGYEESREISVTLNVIHSKYSLMKSLSEQVKDKVKGFELRQIGIGGPFVHEIVFENQGVELYEKEVDLYRCVIEFRLYI